ncbi:cell envelope integrity protein TolA [Roseateles toxinivorans]|uniref:cell envelope integrity protein TolA n=1 Tax=Roseateles toxinivorans TaxID=270368 RepID=UPI0031331D86
MSLALLVHAALVVAIAFSVSWRVQQPPTFEAELWSTVPQAAAPAEQAPPPEPEPEPVKQAKPTPPPEPVVAPNRDADIALEKAREEKKRKAAEEAEKLKEAKEREAKLAKEKLAKEREAERKKLEAEQAKQAKLEQADKLEKARQDKLKQAEAQKKERELEAQRQENLKRIQGMAGASGGPGATGTALQSSGPSASYAGRIKARIRPNIVFSDLTPGNPVAEVEVRVGPDGSILSRKLTKPSGNAEWDKAVLRAIDKTEILPRDVDGRVQPVMLISFQPQE